MHSDSCVNPWYLFKSQPNRENKAATSVSLLGAEVILPIYRTNAPRHYRARTQLKPFFPGYLFISCNPELHHQVLCAAGVASVVRFGLTPAIVPSNVIDELRQRMSASGEIQLPSLAQAQKSFQAGEKVTVINGPFKGIDAIFERELSASDRVSILLDTVKFSEGFHGQHSGCAMRLDVNSIDLARNTF